MARARASRAHPTAPATATAAAIAMVLVASACGSQAPSATATPTPSEAPTPTETPVPGVGELAQSVVQVQLKAGGETVSHGSGTVISADGLILTNAHVATPDFEIDGLVVAVHEQEDAPPVPTYNAEVVASDVVLDLAIIRATETLDGQPYTDGAIPPITIGDSGQVHIGDDIRIFGYPAIGGATITVTPGLVSGFTSDEVLGDRAWIKTDATIAGGNSGGMAANDRGELIGVPTQASAGTGLDPVDCRPVRDTNRDGVIDSNDDCVPIGGFLNGVRPINLAADMVSAVERGVAYEPIGGPQESPPPGFDPTTVTFGRPLFDDVQPDVKPTEDLVWFASGLTELCAWWEYEGMADGVRYDAIWARDGQVKEDISYFGEVWNGGASGENWVCFSAESAIDEGIWDLTLNVEEELVSGGFVGVGDAIAPVEVTVTNASANQTICYLFITPTVTPFWGGDWLGTEEVIGPNESKVVSLPTTSYDLRGDDCQRNILFEDQADFTEPSTYTFSG